MSCSHATNCDLYEIRSLGGMLFDASFVIAVSQFTNNNDVNAPNGSFVHPLFIPALCCVFSRIEGLMERAKGLVLAMCQSFVIRDVY